MKRFLLILFVIGLIGCQSVLAAVAPTVQAHAQVAVPQAQPQVQPQITDVSACNKIFKVDSQKLLYLTLSSINANRFSIDEIQSKGGYTLFSVGQRQFLATIITINQQNSMLKITPCNNSYYFPVGIVQNMFKYIELNINTPVEKLGVS